jgi:hypothetical protein
MTGQRVYSLRSITMKISFPTFKFIDFSELDRQIAKIKELRDSYRVANRSYYGEYLAALLDD